jgi:ring-1,2-phenylacetyl-CoA epoxidase subunit PaaE
MADNFLKLRITQIKPETADATSYFLEPINGREVAYRAGQFLTLIFTHRDNAQYSISLPEDSDLHQHEIRRSYSISSAPGEPLQLTIKRISNGELSRFMIDQLRVGDVLTSLLPAGRFTFDATLPGDVVLMGAGSGITPLFGILKYILKKEPDRHVTLLYSNTRGRNIIFRDELDELQKQFPDRFRLIHLLSAPSDEWLGLRGRLNNVMLERLLPSLVGDSKREQVQFYICGPGDYMRTIQFTLVFSGIRPDQIQRENFVIVPVTQAPPPALAVDRTIMLNFRNQDVSIQVPAYKSILQAALDEGVLLPYSCRGGRCSTCMARCRSGSVHMTINDVLTERDIAEGWILTCTGFPESDNVVIDV